MLDLKNKKKMVKPDKIQKCSLSSQFKCFNWSKTILSKALSVCLSLVSHESVRLIMSCMLYRAWLHVWESENRSGWEKTSMCVWETLCVCVCTCPGGWRKALTGDSWWDIIRVCSSETRHPGPVDERLTLSTSFLFDSHNAAFSPFKLYLHSD